MSLTARDVTSTLRILIVVAMLLGTVVQAMAAEKFCSDAPYYGVIDGDIRPAPTQITIDTDCTFKNFPQDKPLTTTVNFQTNDSTIYLIIFDNVYFTGHMACANVDHRIWFSNSSDYGSSNACQDLFIPVETIAKKNPAGQTTAAVGVPFTYTLTLPSMSLGGGPSVNELHSVTLWDDLTATGADLTYLGDSVYRVSGATKTLLATNQNTGSTKNLEYYFSNIPAGEQIEIEITVVLDDTSTNVAGTQFTNTAKWEFGRLIDGVFYEPLPGEWGISEPITIVRPDIVVTKTGPTSVVNLGEYAEFSIDAVNSGTWAGDAWNIMIVDRLPGISSNAFNGGMCDLTPEVTGVTLAGNPLTLNTDYLIDYTSCELNISLLDAAGPLGPNEHLVINYRTKVDADSESGAVLTNVAGATQWSGDQDDAVGPTFGCMLSDGTEGIEDCQDSHSLLVALSGYFFEKTVANPVTGQIVSTAMPGETLRYTLRLWSIDDAFSNVRFYDELNASTGFVPGSISLISFPPGADISNTGGGVLDIRNLNVAAGGVAEVQFDVTLDSNLSEGFQVINQAELISDLTKIADSDDPNVNGQADPFVEGDEDPTQVAVYFPLPEPPAKVLVSPADAQPTIGQEIVYRISVPGTASVRPLYNIVVNDTLDANLDYLGYTQISGPGVVDNSAGSDLSFSTAHIPTGQQVVIELRARVRNLLSVQQGLSIANTASYTYANTSGGTVQPALSSGVATFTIVEPTITSINKNPSVPAPTAGETLRYSVTLTASDGVYASHVFDAALSDTLDSGLVYVGNPSVTVGSGVGSDNTIGEPVVTGDGSSGSPQTLVWSPAAGNADIDIAKGESVTIAYDVRVLDNVPNDQLLSNSVVAQWTGIDDPSAFERDGRDGIGELNDYVTESATATVLAQASVLVTHKRVIRLVTDASGTVTELPGTSASPGDRLRYTIQIENTSDVPLDNFSLIDELDRLNAAAAFVPGTLALVDVPTGADATGTSPAGGTHGTGLIHIANLNIGAQGEADDNIVVVFEVTLKPVLASGTLVLNQAELVRNDFSFNYSDDPDLPGDSDPTQTTIISTPGIDVEKISTDISGDPDILLAGDTLRYTITVKNVGSENAVDMQLRDQVPTHTTYVTNSTTLNGAAVADPSPGVSPLQNGFSIHSPAESTPGLLLADTSATATNAATVTFDVTVDTDVLEGTIISNQGFVTGAGEGSGNLPEQPSDDPATPTPDDPTLDIVGNLPLVDAQKIVRIAVDQGSPDIVDPGDVLRYTITISNTGAVPATGVVFTDAVPADTTYVANSVSLNGIPVGQPDGGVSPLVSGIPVSSSDLTPPLPASGNGTLSPGASAVITFDVQVSAGVPTGTVISNQGVVGTNEMHDEPTDADGIDANGDQPTQVVVGDVQLLSISKEVFVIGGGTAEPGSELEYLIRVTNSGTLPATNVVVTDDLSPPLGSQVTYVSGSGRLNGSAAGVTFAASLLTADFSGQYGNLEPGASMAVRFRVLIDAALAMGTTITNTGVVQWNTPGQSDSASVSLDVGGTPGSAALNGTVWHDANLDRVPDDTETSMEGWVVELYLNSTLVTTATTDADGAYRFSSLVPNAGTADLYEVRFRAPDAGPATASMGYADSAFTDGPQQITAISVAPGGNLQDLNLPLWPNGAVYNSLAREPVPGATLTLLNAATGAAVPESCFDDPVQQDQITTMNGFYKFDLNFNNGACPAGGAYLIEVTPPATGYMTAPSQVIPPASDASTPPFSVPACPGSADDAVPSTVDYCEVVSVATVPPLSIPAGSAGTVYHLHLVLNNGTVPGQSQIFNNPIPIDPELDGAVAITKTSSLINVTRASLVPYTISVTNVFGVPLSDIRIVDRFPAGFKYVEGSARLDGVPAEPLVNGRELIWDNLELQVNQKYTIELLLVVGSGVSEGEYVNRAQVVSTLLGAPASGQASATVNVIPDPNFDCTDVIGKVFDDGNLNGTQDPGENGLSGVRVVTVRGLSAATDEFGRFHFTCAAVPDEDRGSNFILKLDDRSLPSGYRLTTENPRVQRATRGKMIRVNFGATIHRVVRLDIADGVFEPESSDMRLQWRPRIAQLISELAKEPSVLRLSYLGDVEREGLVDRRLRALKKEITNQWHQSGGPYRLSVETEVFWRRGAPQGGRR